VEDVPIVGGDTYRIVDIRTDNRAWTDRIAWIVIKESMTFGVTIIVELEYLSVGGHHTYRVDEFGTDTNCITW
jgi:hypothetical protein